MTVGPSSTPRGGSFKAMTHTQNPKVVVKPTGLGSGSTKFKPNFQPVEAA